MALAGPSQLQGSLAERLGQSTAATCSNRCAGQLRQRLSSAAARRPQRSSRSAAGRPARSAAPRSPLPATTAPASPSPSPAQAPTTPSEPTDWDESIVGWNWTGSDEFSALGDRLDAPPLPLPRLPHSHRVVLVRHGQSTWNARNRIQGSSNFSVLTELGMEQAAAAQKLLAGWDFQRMFVSPLKRAAQTGEIVWGGRHAPTVQLPCLREIDLYSFQGLDKLENRSLYPDQYHNWQSSPAEFAIDGHAPVRELWYRASLAWTQILDPLHTKPGGCSLVVAHNAVNQALLCTALGLPPAFFRRFSQSNAAFTVLDFEPGSSAGSSRSGKPAAPVVHCERMNQFPDRPMNPHKLGKSVPNRLVLICGEATFPAVQASLNMLASVGVRTPPLIGVGSTAQQALDIRTALQAALSTPGDGRCVVAVAAPAACQQLLGDCLGPPDASAPVEDQQRVAAAVGGGFNMSEGGITIVNWPMGQGDLARGTVLCVNYQLPNKGTAAAVTAVSADGHGF